MERLRSTRDDSAYLARKQPQLEELLGAITNALIEQKAEDPAGAALAWLQQHASASAAGVGDAEPSAQPASSTAFSVDAISVAHDVDALNQRWREAGARELSFGGTAAFRAGLEALIGLPHPRLMQAMQREHCLMNDSCAVFETPNYQIRTTSEVEWHFVVEPTAATLAKLRIDGEVLVAWPDAPDRPSLPKRTARPLASVIADLKARNAQLEALGEPGVAIESCVAARLYSGPLCTRLPLIASDCK